MTKVLILGAGMMGTALAQPLCDRGHEVRLVGTWKDADLVQGMKANRTHAKLGTKLHDRVSVWTHDELPSALQGVEAVALGVSSAGIRWACEALNGVLDRPLPIFMITKGLELHGTELRTLPDVVAGSFNGALRDSLHPAAIAGPCIAGELARCVPTCVVLTGRSESTNRWLVELLQGPYYKVFPTTDVVGVEVCAALKNAFAMGIAFAEGLHKKAGGSSGSVAMHNLESAVFSQAALEMRSLTRALGSSGDNAVGLAGVGDLDVTTNGGRTGRFGRLLGEGLSVEQAIARMDGATLECLEILRVVERAFEVGAFGSVSRTQCPLLSHLIEVALHNEPVALPLERFFAAELSR